MNKPIYWIICLSFCLAIDSLSAQQNVNYDEAKVPCYQLPDLLTMNNGSKVTTSAAWEQQRRSEVMEFFASQVYGRTPKETIEVKHEIVSENKRALGGKATARQVRFIFSGNGRQVEAILLLMLPNRMKRKVPVIVGYNFKGNHSTMTDESILYPPLFKEIKGENHPDWQRGNQASRWCYDRIIDRGYAVATMCYHDIYPDKEGMREQSVAALFSNYNPLSTAPDEWRAIGAWAWGSSRIVDYLETVNQIDVSRIAIMGHSRQGKAALWAGAQDCRFSVVISNDSGAGGAALSMRRFGETVAIVSSIKPAWFCPAYDRYKENEAALPLDQNALLALIAPRKLYVASAEEDLWADPHGEFLSAFYAGAVFRLYNLKPIDQSTMPAIHQPIQNDVGYHIRAGKHDVTDYDWEQFLDFCDKK